MWSRVVEFMLACWLAMSPFIFSHPAEQPALWMVDLGSAVLVGAFALTSYVHRLRHSHVLTIAVAAGLCGFAYFTSPTPTPAAYQNQYLVGLLLIMFAVIPNHASRCSDRWEEATVDLGEEPALKSERTYPPGLVHERRI